MSNSREPRRTLFIVCDGACPNNGKDGATGGYGVVTEYLGERATYSESYEEATNNMMEMQGMIKALELGISAFSYEKEPAYKNSHEKISEDSGSIDKDLSGKKDIPDINKLPTGVLIFCDSAYVVDCLNDRWYVKWEKEGYMLKGEERPNTDLWKKLISLYRKLGECCSKNSAAFAVRKIKGHISPAEREKWRQKYNQKYGVTMSKNLFDKALELNVIADTLATEAAARAEGAV